MSKESFEALSEALENFTKVTVTHGEDNTFGLPYFVKISRRISWHGTEEIHDKIQWCHTKYGPRWDIDNIRGVWDYETDGKFHFKREEDRTMFMLRWAQ
jgi:3-dehydroquinate synthetase